MTQITYRYIVQVYIVYFSDPLGLSVYIYSVILTLLSVHEFKFKKNMCQPPPVCCCSEVVIALLQKKTMSFSTRRKVLNRFQENLREEIDKLREENTKIQQLHQAYDEENNNYFTDSDELAEETDSRVTD